ncbi:F-Box protein, partial [Rhizoctonia solani]
MAANDELERFREEWRQEIRERAGAEPSSSSPASSPPRPRTRQSPIDIYAEAVEREQRGELDEALSLYRRAFRLDPNVDRAYHYRSTTQAFESLTLAPVKPSTSTEPKPEPIHVAATSTHSIRTLISAFPPANDLAFLPEDERQPVPIALVPDELLLHTLKLLDITSIERFALVCRRARVLTVDPDLWRDFVISTYLPPQIPDNVPLSDYITRFDYDMRRLYIEVPRLRMDGVYIAVCHYVYVSYFHLHPLANKPPADEARAKTYGQTYVPDLSTQPILTPIHLPIHLTATYSPVHLHRCVGQVDHLVTYHRYLRFLPDGRVLSLLDQNLEPREAVHIITPDLVTKGFFIGTWTLRTSNDKHHVSISNLTDPAGKFEHSFRMELTLGSKPLGRCILVGQDLGIVAHISGSDLGRFWGVFFLCTHIPPSGFSPTDRGHLFPFSTFWVPNLVPSRTRAFVPETHKMTSNALAFFFAPAACATELNLTGQTDTLIPVLRDGARLEDLRMEGREGGGGADPGKLAAMETWVCACAPAWRNDRVLALFPSTRLVSFPLPL